MKHDGMTTERKATGEGRRVNVRGRILTWVSLLCGAIGVMIALHWSYKTHVTYLKYKAMGAEISTWPPTYISLLFWIGSTVVFVSTIILSRVRFVRVSVFPIVVAMAIPATYLFLFQGKEYAVLAFTVFFTGFLLLLAEALVCVAIKTLSWLRKQVKGISGFQKP